MLLHQNQPLFLPPDADDSSQQVTNLEIMFPCSNPVNPHMQNLQSRLSTFHERSNMWPQRHIAATPTDMSQAGLYYLGTRDRVKCWYCNGGLQNWDRYDNPWFEHAKWFPQCEFLLQQKGPEFVENVTSRFTNLNRPNIFNPVSLSASNIKQSTSLPKIVDPKENQRQLIQRAKEEMTKSILTPEAITMAFTEEEITKAFYNQLKECNRPFASFSTLVNCILNLQTEVDITPTDILSTPQINQVSEASDLTEPKPVTSTDKHVLEDLKHKQSCKGCLQSKAAAVFLPCGQLSTCVVCSTLSPICPICMTRVKERI